MSRRKTNDAADKNSSSAAAKNGSSSTAARRDAGSEANRRAAAILEVLGGLRTPTEAAAALKISVSHYYLLERRALAGLLEACQVKPKAGRQLTPERRLAILKQQLEACRRECQRQAALVRATQRAIGLPPLPEPAKETRKPRRSAKKKASGKRRRRPTVRALQAVKALRENSSGTETPDELEQPLDVTVEPTPPRVAEKEHPGDSDR